jgi:hypothetical protein
VLATGTPTPTYQWQKNNVNISGATSASYTTPATVVGDTGATFRCIVANSAGSVASRAATLTLTAPTGSFATKINFQPASAPTVSGYTVDSGLPFAARNGLTYGWNGDISDALRDRNNRASADQRFDTLAYLQKAAHPNAAWEIAVPNGAYQVRIVAGDPNYINSVFRIAVEDVLAVSGAPSAGNHWIDVTVTITVSDGRLSVSNASGAVNNKICFIEIIQIPTGSG